MRSSKALNWLSQNSGVMLLLEEMLCNFVSRRSVHLGFPAMAKCAGAIEAYTHAICRGRNLDGLAILNEELGELVLLEASHNTMAKVVRISYVAAVRAQLRCSNLTGLWY